MAAPPVPYRRIAFALSEEQLGTAAYDALVQMSDCDVGRLLACILKGPCQGYHNVHLNSSNASTPVARDVTAPLVPSAAPSCPPATRDVTTSRASSHIGATGEQLVREILQREYSVEMVSNKPYSGDILLYRPRKYGAGSINIMVEVKNYRSMVPSAEVEKFQRDAAVMPNIHAALMISLGSPIAGHDSLDIADLAHGRHLPIMYLHGDSPDIILGAARLLYLHVDQFQSIQHYLEQYSEHLYPKIWKGASKALELLQGIAQTRVLLLELRTQMCQKIDKIQERILINETQLTEVLSKLRQRVSEFVPDSLTGGHYTKAEEVWDCIRAMVAEHVDGSAYHRSQANASMIRELVEKNLKLPAGNLMVQLHARVLIVSQGTPAFRLKLMVDSTELSYLPTSQENGIRLTSTQTYDGNWISERVGRKGNLLHPRSHNLKTLTAQAEWRPGDLVEDMLPEFMTPE